MGKITNKKNIAEVIVSNISRNVDKVFHYLVAEKDIDKAKIGIRVLVPFGRGNKRIEGFIIGFTDNSSIKNLKEIYRIFDEKSFFNENMLRLIKWMRKRYLCTYYEAIKVILPPGMTLKLAEYISINKQLSSEDIQKKIKSSPMQKKMVSILDENPQGIEFSDITSLFDGKNIRNTVNSLLNKDIIKIDNKYYSSVKDKTVRLVYLAVEYEYAQDFIETMKTKAPAQVRIIEILLENEFVAPADLIVFAETSYSVLNSLYKKGIVDYRETVIMRNPYDFEKFEKTRPFIPTKEQDIAISLINNEIEKKAPSTIMLRGVTGSGKTEVFLQTIAQVIANGGQAIVLVPEISLTPQMVERFMSRFGTKVAVLHSGLSIGERFDQWKKIRDGQVDVVVGARSAVFAPFKKLRIIILDEEHENTYKSQMSPKYHAREVAQQRSNNENAVLILSSATPSVESYHRANDGLYILNNMTRRYNDSELPQVEIVDLREELVKGNNSIFSERLKQEIQYNLENGQQTILFLNRRGYSTFVSCRSCGYVVMCPHCNISLTYHNHNNTLTCHYCGHTIRNITICPECKSKYIRYFGTGTQKVEREIKQIIPQATVIRMDVDTTKSKFSHEKILTSFKEDNINILIGTQMISKGLDFPNVTLVGVLAADMSLNIDDFRASERTFQLITQVCGRAGRGNIKGRAIIQTYQPEHFTIQMAKEHNYVDFYKNEIQVRKQLKYPPFCQIISILTDGVNEKSVISSMKNVIIKLKNMINEKGYNNMCGEILGPTPSPISKISNRYRWRALLKCNDNIEIRNILRKLLYEHEADRKNAGINLSIDIDPVNMF